VTGMSGLPAGLAPGGAFDYGLGRPRRIGGVLPARLHESVWLIR
jgi:hypothetical protein